MTPNPPRPSFMIHDSFLSLHSSLSLTPESKSVRASEQNKRTNQRERSETLKNGWLYEGDDGPQDPRHSDSREEGRPRQDPGLISHFNLSLSHFFVQFLCSFFQLVILQRNLSLFFLANCVIMLTLSWCWLGFWIGRSYIYLGSRKCAYFWRKIIRVFDGV